MEDGIIDISELKTGQQLTLDIASREVILAKLEEPLHYAFKPMSLQEGMKRNEGKFGKDLVMYDFLGRPMEGIEMEDT